CQPGRPGVAHRLASPHMRMTVVFDIGGSDPADTACRALFRMLCDEGDRRSDDWPVERVPEPGEGVLDGVTIVSIDPDIIERGFGGVPLRDAQLSNSVHIGREHGSEPGAAALWHATADRDLAGHLVVNGWDEVSVRNET